MTTFFVVGDVMTDVVARINSVPEIGTDTAARIEAHGGGGGGNVAEWLASRGSDVHLIARVGRDALGDAVVLTLERANVIVHAPRDPHAPTGTCVVIVTEDGERTMLPDPGANAMLVPADLPESEFASGDHLHVSGYTVLRDSTRLASLAALDLAKRRTMTSSVDASSTAPLVTATPDRFLAWTEGVDICFANAAEARVLTGRSNAADAAADLIQHFGIAVIKLGREGSLAVAADGRKAHAEAVQADVIDTTGAGDAFAAGFLAEWGRSPLGPTRHRSDADLAACLRAGTLLATRAVAGVGGRP